MVLHLNDLTIWHRLANCNFLKELNIKIPSLSDWKFTKERTLNGHISPTYRNRDLMCWNEKTAFIFCVEDRALFCKGCDERIHLANSLAANHQRFLATGIRVALSSSCNKDTMKENLEPKPPKQNSQQITTRIPAQHVTGITSPSWPVDELLQFSDYESSSKKDQLEFGELEWFSDIGLFGEQLSPKALAAEVPQLPVSQPSNLGSYRPAKFYMPHKKPRIEILDDNEEGYFTVPDLG
ncbi:B-box zinc finger protein 24-like [Olea europaea var. sylvestris]|uniref:B-box zinc finger protein 24-like n=1 Tax=Olea europaea var. sylvestris TaxID=158386 RepID=UPI000C1CEA68|nr:B-box zinc finger protein 24-like [Olea europaea var. sylvestris]